ncbi:MFS transporter [Thermomicrobiaceae bacterium CFH 74404]|uniref:MFS transporter n=1 Tax=Thermalbibacter longus TaxID=2951981 RepID=A0AA41WDP5_9BACT|nr:MFS transporter [Thermalbibacter longus]MCM8748145.1 MFS transporter [Thermalbibacter longus]
MSPHDLRTNPWAVLAVLCLGLFMALLDTTIVNIAIPAIGAGLDASLDEIVWIVNAYVLVYAALLITAGRLGDIAGPKRLFLAGMALFTLASALCGLARDPVQLIAARSLQGVGGALMSPQPMAIITRLFPPERRGAAFAIPGILGGLAVAAGPILGGALVDTFGWPAIFLVNVPVGAISLALVTLVVPDLRPGQRHRLDLFGVLLATAGLLALTFGLIEGERYRWGTIVSVIAIPHVIGLGILVLALFLLVQYRRQDGEPLLPFELFRHRNYALTTGIAAAMGFAMLGLFLPFTIYLQSVLGLDAFDAGLTVLPQALVMTVVAGPAGSLADRLGGKHILLAGLTLFASGMAYLDMMARASTARWDLLPALLLMGTGLGCVWAPLFSIAMRQIEPRVAGTAAGVIETIQEIGGVIAGAVVGALLQHRLATALREQALRRSGELPGELREQFLDAVAGAASGGLHVEAGLSAPGVPFPAEIQQLAVEVFRHSFVDAMHLALLLPIVVVLLAAGSCLAIRQEKPLVETEPVTAAPSTGSGQDARAGVPSSGGPTRPERTGGER